MDVDPAAFRHAQAARLGHAGEDNRPALVDLIARHDQPPIGFGDQTVALGQGGQFLGTARGRRSAVRVGGSNLGERRKQLADLQPVIVERQAQPLAPHVLGNGIARDGRADAVLDRGAIDHPVIAGTAIFQTAFVLFGPVALFAPAHQRAHGRDRFGADHGGHL